MRRPNFTRAFSLIELLVVVGIISVITMLLLVQQSRFDSSTVLRSLAYSVALSVRQAQVYGVSVRQTPTGTVFASGYGLYFNPGANAANYLLFADVDSSNSYSSGEEITTFNLNNGYTITEVCAITTSGLKRCTGSDDSSGSPLITALVVLFKRPNPDALFYVTTSASTLGSDVYTSAYIRVSSIDGAVRGVHVYNTGQVSVDSIGQSI